MEEVERVPLAHVYLKGAALYGLYLGLTLGALAVLGFAGLAYFGKYLPTSQGISLFEYVDLRTLIIFGTWLFVGVLMGVFVLTVLCVWVYNLVTKAGGQLEMGLVDMHASSGQSYNSPLLPSPLAQANAQPRRYTQELV